MNGQLPPVDPDLRDQLARRAAGRAPADLQASVLTALDSAAGPGVRWRWARPAWRGPRLLGAGVGLALVAMIAAAVALPALHPGPSSTPGAYPADRALTTAELAQLMAGPALATNTALVASVTIDSRQDVCPMNRYPTLGVVEGTRSQVCVMGSTVSEYLTEAKVSGTFAFRYLGPGYLGLLGEITPTSASKVVFAVTGDWPAQGKTFLVEGWLYQTHYLGNDPAVCDETSPIPAGDALNPNGWDPCVQSWLSETSGAAESSPVDGQPGPGLPSDARSVAAAGVTQIDPVASPGYGVFVVRSTVGPCPSAAPIDSRGCPEWLVMAKVAAISLPVSPIPTAVATPTPTTAPPATPIAEPTSSVAPPAQTGLIGPGNRALTAAEVSALVAADPGGLTGRYVIDKRPTCQDSCGTAETVFADYVTPGWTVGQGESGELVNLAPDGIVWTLPEAIGAAATTPGLFVLDAWISGAGEDSCDVVGQPCYEVSWLGSIPGANEMNVQLGAYHEFGAGAVGGGPPIHGLFLISSFPDKACGLAACPGQATILARLETVSP